MTRRNPADRGDERLRRLERAAARDVPALHAYLAETRRRGIRLGTAMDRLDDVTVEVSDELARLLAEHLATDLEAAQEYLQEVSGWADEDVDQATRELFEAGPSLEVQLALEQVRVEHGLPPTPNLGPVGMWVQVGGDACPSAHGAILGRVEADVDDGYVELVRIEPTEAYMSPREIVEGRLPAFWSSDDIIPFEFLSLNNPEFMNAVRRLMAVCQGGAVPDSEEDVAGLSLLYRAALWEVTGNMHWEESGGGWSVDVLPAPAAEIEWWSTSPEAAEEWRGEDHNYLLTVAEQIEASSVDEVLGALAYPYPHDDAEEVLTPWLEENCEDYYDVD